MRVESVSLSGKTLEETFNIFTYHYRPLMMYIFLKRFLGLGRHSTPTTYYLKKGRQCLH